MSKDLGRYFLRRPFTQVPAKDWSIRHVVAMDQGVHRIELGGGHHIEASSLGTVRETASACVQVDGDRSPAGSWCHYWARLTFSRGPLGR